MDVNQFSVSPPGAFLDKSERVVVKHSEDGDWSSAHYISSVVDAFNELGYDAVIDEPNEDGKLPYGRYMAVYKIDNERDSYQYQYTANEYGMVDSGFSTTNCNTFGSTVSCTENKTKTFGVTGQSTKTATKNVTYRTFYLWLYDLKEKNDEGYLKQVLYTFAFTDEDYCKESYIYKELMKASLSRMKTGPRSSEDIRIDMTECPRA